MKAVYIDVREPDEFRLGHVEGALNIPPIQLLQGQPSVLAGLPRNTPLIIYCRTGTRAKAAIPYFASYGFSNITNGINKDHITAMYPGGTT